MPATWVGLLLAFMPLSMVLVVGTMPLVERLGPKRLMFAAWMTRYLIACAVFLMPWAMVRWGSRASWYVLCAVTLAFCIARAVGAGGWFPWLHEVVPERQRGLYFSTETSIAHLVNVGIAAAQGLVLRDDAGLAPYLLVYGAGICMGLFSLVWMWRVPGGSALEETFSERGAFTSYRAVLRDGPFLLFVLTASLCFSCLSWVGAALVMYLRDALWLDPRTVMLMVSGGSCGILLTIRFWQRFADHSGSGRAMFKTMLAYSFGALLFLTLVPGTAWARYAAPVAVVAVYMFGAAFSMAAHRAMLNYVKEPGRVAYTNVWIVGTALALGLTPIAVGRFVDWWGMAGFQVCFLVAGLLGLVCTGACLFVVRDGKDDSPTWSDRSLINLGPPIRTLARVAWITVGMHESNRPRQP